MEPYCLHSGCLFVTVALSSTHLLSCRFVSWLSLPSSTRSRNSHRRPSRSNGLSSVCLLGRRRLLYLITLPFVGTAFDRCLAMYKHATSATRELSSNRGVVLLLIDASFLTFVDFTSPDWTGNKFTPAWSTWLTPLFFSIGTYTSTSFSSWKSIATASIYCNIPSYSQLPITLCDARICPLQLLCTTVFHQLW